MLGGLPGRKLTYGAHSVHTPDEMKACHWVKRRNEPNQLKRMESFQDERSLIARVTLLEQIVSSRQSRVHVQNVQIRRQTRLSATLSHFRSTSVVIGFASVLPQKMLFMLAHACA